MASGESFSTLESSKCDRCDCDRVLSGPIRVVIVPTDQNFYKIAFG